MKFLLVALLLSSLSTLTYQQKNALFQKGLQNIESSMKDEFLKMHNKLNVIADAIYDKLTTVINENKKLKESYDEFKQYSEEANNKLQKQIKNLKYQIQKSSCKIHDRSLNDTNSSDSKKSFKEDPSSLTNYLLPNKVRL